MPLMPSNSMVNTSLDKGRQQKRREDAEEKSKSREMKSKAKRGVAAYEA